MSEYGFNLIFFSFIHNLFAIIFQVKYFSKDQIVQHFSYMRNWFLKVEIKTFKKNSMLERRQLYQINYMQGNLVQSEMFLCLVESFLFTTCPTFLRKHVNMKPMKLLIKLEKHIHGHIHFSKPQEKAIIMASETPGQVRQFIKRKKKLSQHKKLSFPLSFPSAASCGFGHIYWRNF